MSIRALPSGSFQARKNIGGREHAKTFPNRKEAEEYEVLLRDGGQTLAEWLVIWFDLHRPNIKLGTAVTYKAIVNNHVIEKIGGIPLDQLAVRDLAAWQADLLDDGLAPATVQLARAALKTDQKSSSSHGFTLVSTAARDRTTINRQAKTAEQPPRQRQPQATQTGRPQTAPASKSNDRAPLLKSEGGLPYQSLSPVFVHQKSRAFHGVSTCCTNRPV